jgi:DNA-directed RNA polymerase specialized sigma24 family protein
VLAAHWHRNIGHEFASIEELGDLPVIAEQPASPVAQLVETVLATLPHNYRWILELRFLGGYSVSDSAKQMGVSVANAKVLQHRALRLAAGALNDGAHGIVRDQTRRTYRYRVQFDKRGVTPPPTSRA